MPPDTAVGAGAPRPLEPVTEGAPLVAPILAPCTAEVKLGAVPATPPVVVPVAPPVEAVEASNPGVGIALALIPVAPAPPNTPPNCPTPLPNALPVIPAPPVGTFP